MLGARKTTYELVTPEVAVISGINGAIWRDPTTAAWPTCPVATH
jgi:hypothetical protein